MLYTEVCHGVVGIIYPAVCVYSGMGFGNLWGWGHGYSPEFQQLRAWRSMGNDRLLMSALVIQF